MVYPTANRSVVFMSFQADGACAQKEHVGLAYVEGGRVVRFTDFSGSQPRQLRPVAAAGREDAQSQARALLVSAAPLSPPTSKQPVLASRQAPASAQSQAAGLLSSIPASGQTSEPRRGLAQGAAAGRGDSQAMARALLSWSSDR